MSAVTIRLADPTDRPALSMLWQTAFGEPDYAAFYLEQGLKASQMLLLEEEGSPAAMLALFPVSIPQTTGVRRGNYVYAVATAPAYRGRGYMGRLLQQAERMTLHEGGDCLTLVPAQPSLFSLYARYGFSVCSTQKRFSVMADVSDSFPRTTILEESLPHYFDLRVKRKPHMLFFTGKASAYQRQEATFTGLRFFSFPDSQSEVAAFVEDFLDVREVLGEVSHAQWGSLLRTLGLTCAQIRQAEGETPYAMAKSLTSCALEPFEQSLMLD